MIEIIKAFIYGIVEGITEWLPISSTGHMILLKDTLGLDVSDEFWNMFLVVIQFGAILAVIFLYWRRLIPLNKDKNEKYHFDKPKLWMWLKIIVASIPAAIVGLFLDDYINEYLYNTTVVAIMLIFFGLIFIFVEQQKRRKNLFNKLTRTYKRNDSIDNITFLQAFIIGLFQMIAAILPGTSRSGATIIAALILGLTRTVGAEFTFFLAVPAMVGSSLLKLIKFGFNFTNNEMSILLVGTFTAFFVSIFCIKYLMKYIKTHTFEVFGIYRIALGCVVLAYFGFSFAMIN